MITSAILDEPRLGTAVPGGARLALAWRGRARQGDQQRPGCNAPAPALGARRGVVAMGRPRRGIRGARPRGAGPGMARRAGAWHGLSGVDQASAARPGLAGSGGAVPGAARLGVARQCSAWQGFGRPAVTEVRDLSAHARQGRPGTGMAMPGRARRGAAGNFGRLAEIGVRLLDAHARLATAGAGSARRGSARLGNPGQLLGGAGTPLWIDGVDKTSAAWLGLPRSGEDSRGEARLVLARCGLAMRGRDLSVWTDFRGWARRGLVVLGTARQGQAGQYEARQGQAGTGGAGATQQRLGCDARASHSTWLGMASQCWDRQASVGRGAAWQGRELLH